jgi:hypothetical protein
MFGSVPTIFRGTLKAYELRMSAKYKTKQIMMRYYRLMYKVAKVEGTQQRLLTGWTTKNWKNREEPICQSELTAPAISVTTKDWGLELKQ